MRSCTATDCGEMGRESHWGGARLPPGGGVGHTCGPGLTRIGASPLETSLFRSLVSPPVKALFGIQIGAAALQRSPRVAATVGVKVVVTAGRGRSLLVADRMRAEALDRQDQRRVIEIGPAMRGARGK